MKNQEKPERKAIREIYVYATPLRTIGEAWEEGKEYAIRVQKYTRGFAIFKTPGDRDHPAQFKQPGVTRFILPSKKWRRISV